MKRFAIVAGMVVVVALLFIAAEQKNTAVAPAKGTLQLTIDELAKYNGKNGMPAYVAVDSVIYDQSGVDAWAKGKHKGYLAGRDISKEIKTMSPHGIGVLKKRIVVGRIIPAKVVADTTNKQPMTDTVKSKIQR